MEIYDFDSRLKELRKVLNSSQQEFSKKLKVGYSTLAMWETGQRIPKDIHISQICQTFNVNEKWLRTGEGEKFLKTDDSLLDKLSSEYNLNDTEKKIIMTYLHLDEKRREQFIDFAIYFSNELSKMESSEIAATVAIRPAASDDDVTREQVHRMIDAQFDAKEKGEISSASTGGSGIDAKKTRVAASDK